MKTLRKQLPLTVFLVHKVLLDTTLKSIDYTC